MPKKITTEDFINRARRIHKDRYDYTDTEYINAKTKVCIRCIEHGEFLQLPCHHVNGHGCAKCAGIGQCSTQDFIDKARAIHQDYYDYSKTEYVDCFSKVIIICPTHGEFLQAPTNHVRGHGCDRCGGSFASSTEEFVGKAKIIHGDKFLYDNAVYTGADQKVVIVCRIHGEFEQTAIDHLKGRGCWKCAVLLRGNKKRKRQEDFITEATQIHGNFYGYSKVVYVKTNISVIIECPIHGEFKQRPLNHLHGAGCPKCLYKNQTIVGEVLDSWGIKYESVILRIGNRKLIPDFYLPEYRMFIEYNGIQHYMPTKFGSMSEEQMQQNFQNQVVRDNILRQYCGSEGYALIEINGIKVRGRKAITAFLQDVFKNRKAA